jgi:membrane fusion protein (multidrug efflux system)
MPPRDENARGWSSRRGRRLTRRGWPAAVAGVVVLGALLPLVTRCEKAKTAETKQAPAPPPPAVVVAEVLQKTVPIYSESVARTVALETVELRARVEGFLEQAPFEEGQLVKKGQVLFVIQQAQYQAAVASAQAQLQKAKADLEQAREQVDVLRAEAQLETTKANRLRTKQDVERYRPLAEEQAVPRQDLDTAIARDLEAQAQVSAAEANLKNVKLNTDIQLKLAQAAVEQAQAALTQAQLNLDYTTIRAPGDGIIGVRKVDPGNLVGRGEATLLATMSSVDPFKVEFNVSELDFLRFIKNPEREGVRTGQRPSLTFELILADDSVYPHQGRPRTLDRALDPRTGTILVEALFPNPENLLRAGQFARVRTSVEEIPDAILVPQLAVQEIQGAKSVLVVGPDDKVALRSIKVGERFENFFVVLEGLKAGERIIVEGLQKARPGMLVKPMMRAMTAEPARPKPAEARTPDAKPGNTKAAEAKGAAPPRSATPGVASKPISPRKPSDPPVAGAAKPSEPSAAPPSARTDSPSPDRKLELVLRLLRGESAEAVSQESQVPASELERWRTAFLAAGRRGLARAP